MPSGAPFRIRFDGVEHPACCAGCEAVARTILDTGLDAYYRRREKLAEKAAPLPPELLERIALYDDPAVRRQFVQQQGDSQEASLLLEGITCAACVWLNETTLRQLPGMRFVSVNYGSHRARVRWDPSQLSLSAILEAIARIGYRAHPFDAERLDTMHRRERRLSLTRMLVAGLGMMQVMMFAYPAYFADRIELPLDQDTLLKWASLLLTLPVVTFCAWPFYAGTWRDLKSRQFGMDVPVTLGILGAFLPSLWNTLTQSGGHVYYDSVSMFVFLLLLGRYLELNARRRASEDAERLAKLLPAFAHAYPAWPDTTVHEVPVARLAIGDVVLVKPGETVPVDGTVLEGDSEVSEALLTGESTPIGKTTGDTVVGGSVNQSQPLILRATQVGDDTRVAGIVRLLDRALAEKPRLAELANRYAGRFVVLILLVAAATAFWWGRHDPARALWITVSVLVITCPCALSLATPAALTAATGTLARLGLLVTRGHAVPTLAEVTHVVFDKTGTLTHGRLQVTGWSWWTPVKQGAAIVRGMESRSEHPVAQALLASLGQGNAATPERLQNHRGQGLEADIDGMTYRLGKPDFVAALVGTPPPTAADGAIWLGNQNGWLGSATLRDSLREDAADTLARLKSAGLQLLLASGDQPTGVDAIRQSLPLDDARANLTPEGKLAWIESLQAQGAVVAMVGDGINDAPVLAKAQLSIAMGSGTDIARSSADMVLLGEHLSPLAEGVLLARKTRRIVSQNLLWALCYNGIAIPLAVTGHVTPLVAGAGMAASSLLVVLNALRLTQRRNAG